MRLREVFVEFLNSKNIRCISTNSKKVLREDPIQFIARNFASGKFEICRGRGRFSFNLNGERVDDCEHLAWKCKGISRDEIKDKLDEFPYIVVDCSLKHLHSDKEIKSLMKQIEKTLSVVRKYMWDERLVIAGMKTMTSALHYESVEDFLREKKPEKVILLDPNAEDVFQGERADCYVIGGIVDKTGNKRGTTSLIYKRLVEKGFDIDRRKILLRGDVLGVPDRINHITEIVLKTVLDGMDVEKAIYDVQNRKIARWRLRREITKNSQRIDVNGRPFRIIKKSFYDEVVRWLKINKKDFYRCASEMGVIVVEDSYLHTEKL